MVHHRFGLYEREHAISATEAEQSDKEEGIKQFQEYHALLYLCGSDVFAIQVA